LCGAGGASFTPVYTEATSGVDFASSVEEHLSTLRPKVRREFLRLARRSINLGADVRHDLDDDALAAFAVLVETVCARHGVPSINPPTSLRSIERELGRHVHIIGLWRDGALLGGFLLLHHCDVLYAWIAGLDYEYHKEFGTYYRLYAETLALAERLRVRRIEMGRSMYGFKVRMGFRPQLLVSWFRSTGPHGAELLRTGLPILDEACRTRDRVAAAYRVAGVPVPSELLAPALFRPVGGATGRTATASPASARSPAQ
jgi:predicted N-acyltransferase